MNQDTKAAITKEFEETIGKCLSGDHLAHYGQECVTAGEVLTFLLAKVSEVEKAYGGCHYCYGKGYGTQTAHYEGRGESDIGQGGVVIDEAAPKYVPCPKCERGEQIEKLIKEVATEERAKKAEYRQSYMDGYNEGREDAVDYVNTNLMWGRSPKNDLVITPSHIAEVLEAARNPQSL